MATDGGSAFSAKTPHPDVQAARPSPPVLLRPALPEDAAAAATVVAGSIRSLCRADHGDDPAVLAVWLANKTPEGLAVLIADPQATVWLALVGACIAGVGQTTAAGHVEGPGKITLNYVAPDWRGQGVSTALLAQMEATLAGQGVVTARLTSTTTARAFYLARGWSPAGPPRSGRWIVGHPLEKRLVCAAPGIQHRSATADGGPKAASSPDTAD